MNIALWVVAGITAAANLAAGGMKTFALPKFLESAGWAKGWPDAAVRTIGILEILGAIGIILPQATGIAAVLTILAAAGLVLIQLGAAILHLTRKEFGMVPMNVVLLALPLFVFLGRLFWS